MRAIFKSPALWVGLLFALLLLDMQQLAPAFDWAFPEVRPEVFDRASFIEMFWSHLKLVAAASGAATVVGIGLAIFATRSAGRDFRTLINVVTTIGQTFPPAAVLALAVPALGLGPHPTTVALFLYGLLPIVENSIAGRDDRLCGWCAHLRHADLRRARRQQTPIRDPGRGAGRIVRDPHRSSVCPAGPGAGAARVAR